MQGMDKPINNGLLTVLNHFMESLILAQGERWRRA